MSELPIKSSIMVDAELGVDLRMLNIILAGDHDAERIVSLHLSLDDWMNCECIRQIPNTHGATIDIIPDHELERGHVVAMYGVVHTPPMARENIRRGIVELWRRVKNIRRRKPNTDQR